MSDAPQKQPPTAGLTPEQVVQKRAQLEMLLRLKAEKDAAATAASAGSDAAQSGVKMGYGYDDEGDDDDDAFEHGANEDDAVMDWLEGHMHGGKGPTHSTDVTNDIARTIKDLGEGDTVATTAEDFKYRELGDFELLRLAKMGDALSLFSFAKMTGADLATFVDNQGANALHYAADSGNVELLHALVQQHHVPYVTSDKGTTPLDIAVATEQPEAVLDALKTAAAASQHADATAPVRSFDAVLQKLAPAPPRFVMSKPTPKAAMATTGAKAHTFWGALANTPVTGANVIAPPAGETVAVLGEESQSSLSVSQVVQQLYRHRGTSCGCSGWLRPLEVISPLSTGQALTVVTALKEGTGTMDGIALAVKAGGQLCRSSGSCSNSSSSTPLAQGLAVADHLATVESASGTGLSAALMSRLGASLAADGATHAIAFTSATQLPTPPAPVCMVKWYQRAMQAMPIFSDYGLTKNLFPDFNKYDEKLRADYVLKGAVPPALTEKHATTLPTWMEVDPDNATQAALTAQFLAEKTASCGAELFYCPKSAEDLQGCGLLSAAVKTYVRADPASGALVDLVSLSVRTSTTADESPVLVAQLVYAAFTSLKGTDKAEHLLLIASLLLKANALLVPGLFGFTESDLVKANFEELTAAREFAYVLVEKKEGAGGGVEAAAAGVPPAKVTVPLFLL